MALYSTVTRKNSDRNRTITPMKTIKLFITSEQVEKFRTDLEKGTEKKFKEIDRNKRKTFIKSREIVLD